MEADIVEGRIFPSTGLAYALEPLGKEQKAKTKMRNSGTFVAAVVSTRAREVGYAVFELRGEGRREAG